MPQFKHIDGKPTRGFLVLLALFASTGCHMVDESSSVERALARLPMLDICRPYGVEEDMLCGGNLIEGRASTALSTNITAHPSGMAYPAEAFINVIRKGSTLSPLMPWMVYRHMTDDDLKAVHTFLRTMLPVTHVISNAAEPTWCAVCEQEHSLGELNRVEQPEGVAIDPALFEDYVGAYRSEEYGFVIRVMRDGDRLRAQEDDGPVADLVPQSDTRFLMVGGIAPLRFVRDEAGQVTRLVSEEVEELVLRRVE